MREKLKRQQQNKEYIQIRLETKKLRCAQIKIKDRSELTILRQKQKGEFRHYVEAVSRFRKVVNRLEKAREENQQLCKENEELRKALMQEKNLQVREKEKQNELTKKVTWLQRELATTKQARDEAKNNAYNAGRDLTRATVSVKKHLDRTELLQTQLRTTQDALDCAKNVILSRRIEV